MLYTGNAIYMLPQARNAMSEVDRRAELERYTDGTLTPPGRGRLSIGQAGLVWVAGGLGWYIFTPAELRDHPRQKTAPWSVPHS